MLDAFTDFENNLMEQENCLKNPYSDYFSSTAVSDPRFGSAERLYMIIVFKLQRDKHHEDGDIIKKYN